MSPAAGPSPAPGGAGEYTGPLASRQGKPMRPDVAQAFDRMAAAARADGVSLIVNSGFRTDAEQAALFAANPDPNGGWPGRAPASTVSAPSSTSGPPSAQGWLAANAERFGFVQRYAWEPWHFGYVRNAGTSSVGYGSPERPTRGSRALLRPGRVPRRDPPCVPALERLGRAAQRAAVRRVQLQPVRGVRRGSPGHRAVHAGHGERLRAG